MTGAEAMIRKLAERVGRLPEYPRKVMVSVDNEGLLALRGKPEDVVRLIQKYHELIEENKP